MYRLALATGFIAASILGTVAHAADGSREIVLRLQDFALNVEPALLVETDSRRVSEMLHLGLVQLSHDGRIAPGVAESWKWEGNRIEFQLSKAATFSDGRLVKSEDVKASLCKLLQPTSPYNWILSMIVTTPFDDNTVGCSGIEVVDDDTVRLLVEGPSTAYLMQGLAAAPAAITPAKNGEVGEFGVGVGAGPYVVETITANDRVVLAARQDGVVKPGVDRIVFRYIPDNGTAVRLFEEGALDVLEIFTPEMLDRVAPVESGLPRLRVPGRIYGLDVAQLRMVIVNRDRLRQKGFSEAAANEFPRYFQDAIIRERLAAVFGALGRFAASAFPPFPATARVELDKPDAEFPETDLEILSANDRYSDAVAAALPTQIGNVRLRYTGVPKPVMIDRLVRRDYDLVSQWFEAVVDTPYYWSAFFRPGNPFTLFGTAIDVVETIDMSAPDGLARAAEEIDRHGNWVPLFVERRYYAFAPGVVGERLLDTGLISYRSLTLQ